MNMKRNYLILALAAVLSLFASCGKDEAEVIPRGKLAKIYADMMVTDQWIHQSAYSIRTVADTSLVYAPILERYGYDIDDYIKSVDHYMNDPERYSRIFRTAGEIIDKKLADAKARQEILDRKARLPKIISDFKPEMHFPYLFDEPYVHYYDSLGIEMDSLTWQYCLVSVERADTIYDQLRMIVLDSVPDIDSAAVEILEDMSDTLAVSHVADIEKEILKKVEISE